MKNKRQTLKTDFYRAFSSLSIYMTIIAVIIICIASNWEELKYINKGQVDVVYLYDILMGLGAFKNMVLIAAAMPYTASFCIDWNDYFIRPTVVRSGVSKYAWSKVVTCAVTTFFAIFAGLLLFVLLINIKVPLYTGDIGTSIVNRKPYGTLLLEKLPIFYFLARISLLSMACVFWSVVGLCISAFIPNRFVAAASPFIAYYLLGEFGEYLPSPFNFRMLAYGFDVIGQGPGVTIVYTIAFFGFLTFLCGWLFVKTVKRRIGNEFV